jgi:hypothetical protein
MTPRELPLSSLRKSLMPERLSENIMVTSEILKGAELDGKAISIHIQKVENPNRIKAPEFRERNRDDRRDTGPFRPRGRGNRRERDNRDYRDYGDDRREFRKRRVTDRVRRNRNSRGNRRYN